MTTVLAVLRTELHAKEVIYSREEMQKSPKSTPISMRVTAIQVWKLLETLVRPFSNEDAWTLPHSGPQTVWPPRLLSKPARDIQDTLYVSNAADCGGLLRVFEIVPVVDRPISGVGPPTLPHKACQCPMPPIQCV